MNRRKFAAFGANRGRRGDAEEEDEIGDFLNDEEGTKALKGKIEGEEEDGHEKFNDMGEVMEPFNMREERQMGNIDENFNFTFKKEKGEVDAWLATLDKSAMERGIREAAAALRAQKEKKRKSSDLRKTRSRKSAFALTTSLIDLLKHGESISSAIRRLSGKGSSNIPGKRSANSERIPASEDDKATMTSLMEYADELVSLGATDLYSLSHEQLSNAIKQWEYLGQDGGAIHGPFTSEQIVSWRSQGYFTGPTAVQIRPAGSTDYDWISSDELVFPDISQLKALSSKALPLPDDDSSDEEEPQPVKRTSKAPSGRITNIYDDSNEPENNEDADEVDEAEDALDSDAEADNNLRDKRSRGKVGGVKYTSKDDSESDEDN